MGRLKKYSEALPASPEMEAFVADVYLGVGELAVDSQRYYLRPPYGRSAPHVILRDADVHNSYSPILAGNSAPTKARHRSES